MSKQVGQSPQMLPGDVTEEGIRYERHFERQCKHAVMVAVESQITFSSAAFRDHLIDVTKCHKIMANHRS